MDSNEPLVSILITAFNREKYIAEAIESVLASTYKNFEAIVVDDSSADNTFAIANTYASKDSRVKVFANEKNLGQFANRNKAASLASGVYIKYLDSDDFIYPGSLQYMVDAMQANPACGFGMAFNNTSKVAENEFPFFLPPQQAYLWHFEKGGLLFRSPSHTIFRLSSFKAIKGFPMDMQTHGDSGVNLRLAATGGVIVMKPGLVNWRRHDMQVAAGQFSNAPLMMKERFAIHKRILNEAGCPLSAKQKKRAMLVIEVMYLRAAVSRHLFKYGFKPFWKLLSKETVPAYKLPLIFMPLSLMRKQYI